MVNPEVHGYSKTQIHQKILRKPQKTTTYWKPKEYYNRNVV